MANFVSFNFKYYKHSNRNTLGHNGRIHTNIDNVRTELSPDNFGLSNTLGRYQKVYDKVVEMKGKNIQKNANTFIDGVLAFSRDQVRELHAQHGKEKTKELLDLKIRQYMAKLRDEFGFTPVSYDFHADEGHWKDGEWLENYHAHIIMFNYDMKTGTAPLRKMMGKNGKRQTSLMQDLAGEAFAPLGFVRGESVEATKRKHLEKDEYIAHKHNELISEINTVRSDLRSFVGTSNRLYAGILDELDEHRSNEIEFVKKMADAYGAGLSQDQEMHQIITEFFHEVSKNDKLKESIRSLIEDLPECISNRIDQYVGQLELRIDPKSSNGGAFKREMNKLNGVKELFEKKFDKPKF
jgi:hypothetical protein